MARKARPATVAQDQKRQGMTFEERFDTHYPLIRNAKNDAEAAATLATKANAVFRTTLKAFKKDGGNTAAMIRLLQIEKLEPKEVDLEFRDLNAMLKLRKIPVGTQLGLDLATGKSIATAVEDEKIAEAGEGDEFDTGQPTTEETLRKAQDRGYADGIEGKTAFNPYADGSPEALKFQNAYMEGQKDLAKRLTPRGKGRGVRLEERPLA